MLLNKVAMCIDQSQSLSSYIDETENHLQEDVNVQIGIVVSLIACIFMSVYIASCHTLSGLDDRSGAYDCRLVTAYIRHG